MSLIISISTHAPLARCDSVLILCIGENCISTHAPLARCDVAFKLGNLYIIIFQLTHLLRGATGAEQLRQLVQPHFNSRTSCEVRPPPGGIVSRQGISTHAPLARCDKNAEGELYADDISTHAPLARCDPFSVGWYLADEISTHAPLARCDARYIRCIPGWKAFQLTHLLRGATGTTNLNSDLIRFQLTHLLRGATAVRGSTWPYAGISTHAPLARCDGHETGTSCAQSFQLTHLLRGATMGRGRGLRRCNHFNSRTSCEVRHGGIHMCTFHHYFNLRTSCEVRPAWGVTPAQLPTISTHAPLARCDENCLCWQHGRRISTHAPLARCDLPVVQQPWRYCDFNSRTSCEVRRIIPPLTEHLALDFNSRTSCEVRRRVLPM